MFSLAFIRDNFTFIFKRAAGYPGDNVIVLTLFHSAGRGAGMGDYSSGSRGSMGAKVFLSFSRSVPVLVMLYFFFLRLAVDSRRAVWRPAG